MYLYLGLCLDFDIYWMRKLLVVQSCDSSIHLLDSSYCFVRNGDGGQAAEKLSSVPLFDEFVFMELTRS
jgi:hypothetical protein